MEDGGRIMGPVRRIKFALRYKRERKQRERVVKRLREDYRTFDMREMKHWGFNAFWWPSRVPGKNVCIFAPYPVQDGDLLVGPEGEWYVLALTDHPSNPGDQYFANLYPLEGSS